MVCARENRKDQLIFYNRGLDCSISRERKPPGFKRQKRELKVDLLTFKDNTYKYGGIEI